MVVVTRLRESHEVSVRAEILCPMKDAVQIELLSEAHPSDNDK